MASSTTPSSLKLSANELRTMTKWPDPVIYEFLALQGAVSNITNIINIVINNGDSTSSIVSVLQAQVNNLNRTAAQLEEQIAGLDDGALLQAQLNSLNRALAQFQEQFTGTAALVAHNQARIDRQAVALANLQQELAGG